MKRWVRIVAPSFVAGIVFAQRTTVPAPILRRYLGTPSSGMKRICQRKGWSWEPMQ